MFLRDLGVSVRDRSDDNATRTRGDARTNRAEEEELIVRRAVSAIFSLVVAERAEAEEGGRVIIK